jgi:diguanylate cyclase (GGDEF)-like protein
VKTEDKAIRRLALWSRISAIGLTLVLLGGAAYGPWVARRINAETAESRRVAQLDLNYEAASDALNQENIYEERFRNDPSALNLNMHRDFATDVETALENVVAIGNVGERRNASVILVDHRAYVEATDHMFASIQAHRPARQIQTVDRASVEPVHTRLAKIMSQTEGLLDSTLSRRESEFQSASLIISQVAMGISFVGLMFLCVFFFILESYRRRTITIHRAELTRFEEAALTDNLTALGNHRAFQEDLRREFSRATRHDEALSLALIDVDDLKVVNDSSGHQSGDLLLVGLAESLQGLRAEDRAYRIGGDEFAVLLAYTTLEEATAVMARLQVDVRENLAGATISIGLASCRGSDRDPEIVRAQADAALYVAKRAGRNAIEAFDEEKDGMWLLSSTKVRNLRLLIAEGEMGVAFQPIWDVDRCNVLAYEALARPADKYGFAGPQDAFDLADRIGRAPELDAVCRAAILGRAGDLPADALLFINICPQSLDHESFNGAGFAELVNRAGLSPSRVVVEITERAVARLDAVVAAALELRRVGFRLALDDTGAGNSGLEMLSKLPVDFVKIDRMIIVNAVNDVGARGVLAGIIAIARAIGAYVIAEGIEDEQMLRLVCSTELGEAVRSVGVNGVQGYLLQRPTKAIPDSASLDGTRELLVKIGAHGARKAPALAKIVA